ncbi:hypothetical protein WJX84_011296 [Apatococcus fuscideae]|uniref:Early light-induced protein n=1 Tax=Apatococcus fuscideae TaxID=2026836 RepID=A0AAW1TD02_9CHLO
MQQSLVAQQQLAVLSGRSVTRRPVVSRPRHVVRMAKEDEKPETSSGTDSYAKIEAPVRDTIPDGARPVSERDTESGQLLRSKEFNRDTEVFGTEIGVADAMRFMGAIPEVANCRLSMLGVLLAIGFELGTGKNVFEQVQSWPWPTVAVFFLITIATAVPVLKGVPRRGNGFFKSDAEIINGRFAMIGFAFIVFSTALKENKEEACIHGS